MRARLCILVSLLGLDACCHRAPCSPPTVVPVERSCILPPLILPEVTPMPCPTQASLACFDAENAGKLAQRLAALKDWVIQARTRCSVREEVDSGHDASYDAAVPSGNNPPSGDTGDPNS